VAQKKKMSQKKLKKWKPRSQEYKINSNKSKF
jgi:hypothetical protein